MANTKANATKATKATNFDAMRPVLVGMHNLSNKKAITPEYAEAFGSSAADLNVWAGNIRVLWEKCYLYTSKRSARRFDLTITEEVLAPLRDDVFTAWKTLIASNSKKNQLPVDNYDVEALTEFSWRFLGTENGTAEAVQAEKSFRLDVEKLVGVKIARNAMLSDEDRDTLKAYNKAVKGEANAKTVVQNQDLIIKNHEVTLAGLSKTETGFKDYLNKLIKDAKKTRDEAETRATENAERALKLLPDVQKINAKIAKA